MAEYPIDFSPSCRQEKDGSLTVIVQITGIPDMEMANKVSNWMRDCIRENAHKIGRRAEAPARQ